MLERFSTYIKVFLGIVASVGVILSFNAYFAKAADLKKMGQRLEYKISRDDMRDYQEQMWRIEDRYGNNEGLMPAEIREQYRCLERDYEEAKDRVDDLRGTE